MPILTPSSDLVIDLESLVRLADTPPPCECRHSDDPDGLCGDDVARVTVMCMAEGCDCAVSVTLLCRDCLAVWRRDAGREGVTLRVIPL